jgi:hypothetical protein
MRFFLCCHFDSALLSCIFPSIQLSLRSFVYLSFLKSLDSFENAPLAFITFVVKQVVGLTLQSEPKSKSLSNQALTRVVAKNLTPTIIDLNSQLWSLLNCFNRIELLLTSLRISPIH